MTFRFEMGQGSGSIGEAPFFIINVKKWEVGVRIGGNFVYIYVRRVNRDNKNAGSALYGRLFPNE